ncbi:tetraacyldisaccharide 4'-kinase [Brevundimonas sp. SORGH_AS_0993]|uniref:tetraacyldisaccharide 4'-kinase n=1 Tax=Brevundimonas sp. SORGH_AS_0993 TaxID=3041794 RepID=UPI002780DC04|nr:tetraacyldisaccharide 4'-kinase [Brevundimonas sp. SORGH_AS_0993]MDQ1152890.1 tetraacyldisaccharide 4'-kinase [Brevundimonas sp. SORGH_AS_0993]
MKLNTPRWWYVRDSNHARITRTALKPLGWVWAAATARRIAKAAPVDPGGPVISVGNLTVGGSGKTPVAREILRLLRDRGLDAHALSRGYGGRLEGPTQVDPAVHAAADVGDEPLMLAQGSPAWIARDRVAGAKAAVAEGAQALVLDDGHQNPALNKTVSLIVVDGETRGDEWPFGDGSVFPSGPMREPLKAGLARADAVVILAPTDAETVDGELFRTFGDLPIFVARLTPEGPPPSGAQVGFAGIAKPWKVERSLKAAGCDLVDFVPFPDHAAYSHRDMAFLRDRAAVFGAGLVTTEKDWVRLTPAQRVDVTAWPVVARFEDEAAFAAFLTERIQSAR